MSSPDSLSLAGLVHDLNNVFQTLVGVAIQLEENPDSAKPAAAILRCVERGKQIAAGMQNGQPEPARLERIVANAASFVNDFQAAARGPAVEVFSTIEPGIELPGQWAWERVMINLFLNSARAMPQGGKISVHARTGGDEIEITVVDEGSGIPQEVQAHLFEPHVSTHGSSGLGLHIVESIVLANSGSIRSVAPAPGSSGAEFLIRLPRVVKFKAASI